MKNKNLSLNTWTIVVFLLYAAMWLKLLLDGASSTLQFAPLLTAMLAIALVAIPIVCIPIMILQTKYLLVRQIGVILFLLLHTCAIIWSVYIDIKEVSYMFIGLIAAIIIIFVGILFAKNHGITGWNIIFPNVSIKEQMNVICEENPAMEIQLNEKEKILVAVLVISIILLIIYGLKLIQPYLHLFI